MGLYGRREVPGEKGVSGVLDQRAVLNRTIRAQVSAVNPENGYVILTYENMPSGGKYATVPPLWMSFPDSATNSGPAWGRFMPQQSDLVKVSFDYDDRPHIVGYDIKAGKDDVADGESGWPQLLSQYQSSRQGTDPDRAKFAQFIPLNPGEFDFMSSGGSYIYGNNRGKLYLAGGSVSVSLTRNDLRLSQRAQLWTHNADDSEFRFGQVRRLDPTDQLEKPVGSGQDKELSFILKRTTTPGTTMPVASVRAGNLLNSSGVIERSSQGGQDLRYSYTAFNDAGAQAAQITIDKAGNLEIIGSSAPSGAYFDFSVGSISLKASKVLLGGPGAETNPLLLSSVYRQAETNLVTDLAQQVSNLASELATLAGTVGTLAGLVPGGAASAIAAAGSAVKATVISGQVLVVSSTFTGSYDSYLSTVSSTR
jgi:hypothetical protein